ncbi:DUF1189 domain-containing protein [Macrococcus capreoli]|uniref:DUF1189 domain-containing protein n=1 Tax=Macrococcus capreoli TaxID=2982690 RepID=UPI0021D5BE80|nr:DUF1189 domain-containing protein [Macrococcus sp. TMW 2.2395]MCU7556853.1 DUF1189 domain-containing protein [Macrococcus sp. TMW 2.2395]
MYIKHLKRIFTPKQYPLFRIVKLRYIFLHILLISTLFALSPSIQYYQAIQVGKQLIETKQHEIPDFTIQNNQLLLEEEKKITIPPYTIIFTNHQQKPQNHIMTFQKDGIQVDTATFLPYANLPVFHDKVSLINFLKTYTTSSYFYLSLIISILISIQFVATTIKIILVSCVAHIMSRVMKKKSRFMNWLKIITFLLTIPSIFLIVGLFVQYVSSMAILMSWLSLTILVVFTIRYLPVQYKNEIFKQNNTI